MNILVVNGSPKGKNSVTIQTALYLEKRNPQHTFTYLNAAQKIRSFEKDFSAPQEAFQSADVVLFFYPVYTLLVPYQLHRFFELMTEHGVKLEGKMVSQMSTSKHFFDTTAHKFVEENLLDFGGNYLVGFSTDMEDLLEEKGRKQADNWFDKLIFDIEIQNYKVGRVPEKQTEGPIFYPSGGCVEKVGQKKVVVVTNVSEEDENLQHMIEEFIALCPYEVVVQNLRKFSFQGGCIGCLKCSVGGDCFYTDKFQDLLREEIQSADSIVYAFTISNHYTHSSFKCYDDRQFCNGHRAVTHGMPVGYIIAGEYSKESNLQVLVEARCEVGGVYLAGLVSDEMENITLEMKKFCLSLDYALKHPISKPKNFYGVGGTKIFRDLVYLMQGMMKADHKFYKEQGIYDFPHNQKLKMFQMKLIGGMMALPNAQQKMGDMSKYILMPYDKVIENTTAKK